MNSALGLGSARFSQAVDRGLLRISANQGIEKPACFAVLARITFLLCTKSWHRLVDELHSIEKASSCRRVFSIDEISGRSRTGSFFDSFLSFSGWCGVRGSSGVTFSIARCSEGGLARVYSKALVEENEEETLKAR